MCLALLAAGVILSNPTPDAAQAEISRAVLSKAHWTSFNWTTSAADVLAVSLAPVALPKGEDVDWGKTVRRSAALFEGAEVEVSLVERAQESPFRAGFVIRWKDLSGTQCRDVLRRFQDKLGPANAKGDFSFNGSALDMTSFRSQWDLGSSRVGLECLVISGKRPDDKPDGVLAFFAFEKNTTEQDKTPTWIRCSRRATVIAAGEPAQQREMSDSIFIIDDYRGGRPLTGDMALLPTKVLDSSQIIVERVLDKRTQKIKIDRISGIFWEEQEAKALMMTVSIHGQCTKFDPSETKF